MSLSQHEGEVSDTRLSASSSTSQSYPALVWRRFRKSVPGMLGLILVGILLVVSVFADFVAPVDPNDASTAFAPPDRISFFTPDGFTLWPVAYPIVETEELDPITFQPLIGPDFANPRPLALFAKSEPYEMWGFIPMERRLIGTADGTTLHILGTDKLGRDILSRGIVGSRISLIIALTSITLITVVGTLLGITSGYIPLGAVGVSDRVAQVLLEKGGEFAHGHTYSGHPAACAAAIATLNILRDEKLVERVRDDIGPYLKQKWQMLADHPIVGEAVMEGMIGAFQFTKHKSSRQSFDENARIGMIAREHSFKNGLVMRAVGDRMVIAPPFTLSHEEADELVAIAQKVIDLTYADAKSNGLIA